MAIVVVGHVSQIERIAVGARIREYARLVRTYGPGRWRKLKGIARVRVGLDRLITAEIHWYEAHGVGRKELKIKRILSS